MRHKITAYSVNMKRRVHIFTWTKDPKEGIAAAEQQAKDLGLEALFHDYRAEEITE